MLSAKFPAFDIPSIFIPFSVLEDFDLKQGSKLCYGGLVYFAQDKSCASPKRRELASLLNVSTTQIDTYLHDLEKHDYIRINKKALKGNRNLYCFLLHRSFYRNPAIWKISTEEVKKRNVGTLFSPLKYLHGAYLPVNVLQDTNIAQATKVCLARLVQYDWKNMRNIFVSRKTLAKDCGATLTQVDYYLKNLQETGYIEIKKLKDKTYCIVNQDVFFGRKLSEPRKTGKTKTVKEVKDAKVN